MDKKPPHAGGRPTKYDPKFVEELDTYLALIKDNRKILPTVEGFAEHIGVDDTTLLNWARKKLKDESGNLTKKLERPQFFAAIRRLKSLQKKQLINDGLYGGREVNAIMAIFLLKTNHGMVETNRTELTGKNGKELPVPILNSASNVPTNDGNK